MNKLNAAIASFLAAGLLAIPLGSRAADEEMTLFISPCGQPFTGPLSQPYPLVKWFNQADTNHDGKLAIDEMRADADVFFKALDRNHDGVLDRFEVDTYERNVVPMILGPSASLDAGFVRVALQYGPGGGGMGGGGGQSAADPDNAPPQTLAINQGAAYFSLFNEPEPVMAADRNFDFRVTLQEFEALSDRHFHTLDKENQGYLTIADLPKTQAERDSHAKRFIAKR